MAGKCARAHTLSLSLLARTSRIWMHRFCKRLHICVFLWPSLFDQLRLLKAVDCSLFRPLYQARAFSKFNNAEKRTFFFSTTSLYIKMKNEWEKKITKKMDKTSIKSHLQSLNYYFIIVNKPYWIDLFFASFFRSSFFFVSAVYFYSLKDFW